MSSIPASFATLPTNPVAPAIKNRVFPSLSPLRLRAIAHLYGVETVPLEQARVLEVGSGIGNQLLPYALAYPDAQLLGLCRSHRDQEAGTRMSVELGLTNLHILAADLFQLDPESIGEFDYILVPNLYNTLAPAEAQSMLQTCEALLSPKGIMCIAYDVYPGAKATEVVRDAMLMHSASSVNPAEIEERAGTALALFIDGQAPTNPQAGSLHAAAIALRERLDAEGAQTIMAEQGSPCYFIEFLDKITQAGLTYIGDAEPQLDLSATYGNSVALTNSMLSLGQPAAMRQQYLDFSTGRGKRHTLLTRLKRHAYIGALPNYDRLADLNWASALVRIEDESKIDSAVFADPHGRLINIDDPVTITVLNSLGHAWPATLSFTTLLNTAENTLPKEYQASRNLSAKITELLKGWFEDKNNQGTIQYCLGPGPYDALITSSAHLVPGLAENGIYLPDNDFINLEITNLWYQPWSNAFSSSEQRILRIWAADGIKASTVVSIDDKNAISERINAAWVAIGEPLPTKDEMRTVLGNLLLKLHHRGLLIVNGVEWRKLLYEALLLSAGTMHYWPAYISALARQHLLTCHDEKASISLMPPQAIRECEKAQALIEEGSFSQAESLARKITVSHPNHEQGWLLHALSLARLHQHADALPVLLRAIDLKSDALPAYLHLLEILLELFRIHEGSAALNRALELKPNLPNANSMQGTIYKGLQQYKKAEEHFRRQVALTPTDIPSILDLGTVLLELGHPEKAEISARAVLDKTTGNDEKIMRLYQHYLYALNYNSFKEAKDIFSDYQDFNQRFLIQYKKQWQPHKNRKNANRRLKIGYVSPDFRNHAVSKFLEPLIANHDHTGFEIYAYANQSQEDEVSKRYKSYVDHWQLVRGLNSDALAAKIRQDEIDILVDVAGHTHGNRLSVFARKPAPVSVSWLGYGYTTGLSAIDYFLGDDYLCPTGSESVFAETPWRLPVSNYVYRANWTTIGEEGALPALLTSSITFGTLTRAIRINSRVVRTWAAILQALPGSRLVVNSLNYSDAHVCADLAAQFSVYGVEKERLSLSYQSPPWDSLRNIDIGLDCFPHNSGTTLFDTLCMGVPFVTLAGRPGVGGIGSSILNGVGHAEWIAHSEAEYIEKVLELASDIPRLAHIRNRLRDELKKSPLMDEPGFARKVEDSYRQMFQNWLENKK